MISDWNKHNLGDLYNSSSGLSKGRKDFGFGHPFLTFKEVFNNYFVPEKLSNLANTTERERNNCSIKKGDIFITRTSETQHELGMSSVALKDYPEATFNGFTKRLRIKANLDFKIHSKYMGYYLRSVYVRNQIHSFSTLTTRSSLNNSMLKKIQIFLPKFEEQKVIGDTLFCIDQKIELNNAINKNLEEMAQALFKRWFVDFEFPNENGEPYKSSGGEFEESELGLIPKGWKISRMSDFTDILMGQSPKSEFYNTTGDGMPFHQGVSDYGDRFPIHRKYCSRPLRVAKKGSILVSVRAPVGRLNIADQDIIIGRGLGAINSKINCNSYIYYLLRRVFEIEDQYGSGTIFNSITRKEIEEIKIITSSSSIVIKFEEIVKKVDEQVFTLCKENQSLVLARDSLLPKLMSGEIRVPVERELTNTTHLPMVAESNEQYNSIT